MRKILFRGIDKRGVWHYGFIWKDPSDNYYIKEKINNTHYADYEVIEDSIGQFIGLEDKNKKKIFEGDIIKFEKTWSHSEEITTVDWDSCYVGFEPFNEMEDTKEGFDHLYFSDDCEVIGNKFEHKKFLGNLK
jgi:uncharacterized phage protein (TIGR01671 family)